MYLVHQLCNLRDGEERSIHCDTHYTNITHSSIRLSDSCVSCGFFFLCHCIASHLPRCRLTYAPFFTFVQKQIECDRAEATIPVYMECFSNWIAYVWVWYYVQDLHSIEILCFVCTIRKKMFYLLFANNK